MVRADIPVPCGRPSFLSFFLIIIRSAVLFNIRSPLHPCCCSPATSKGFFLFPLQFCRFFALSAKFPVYSGRKQKTPEFPHGDTLVQHITPPCPVAAGCAVLQASSRLSTPARKKCIFFTEEVRTTCTVCTCTHPYGELKQIKTCYRLYFIFPYAVRTLQVI